MADFIRKIMQNITIKQLLINFPKKVRAGHGKWVSSGFSEGDYVSIAKKGTKTIIRQIYMTGDPKEPKKTQLFASIPPEKGFSVGNIVVVKKVQV